MSATHLTRVVFVALAIASAAAPWPVGASERVVECRDGTLTVRLDGVPSSEVLAEIARASGAEIRGALRDPRPISGTFDALPLQEGLGRLLPEQGFALTYRGGRLAAIELFDVGKEPPRAPPLDAEPATTYEAALRRAATALSVAQQLNTGPLPFDVLQTSARANRASTEPPSPRQLDPSAFAASVGGATDALSVVQQVRGGPPPFDVPAEMLPKP